MPIPDDYIGVDARIQAFYAAHPEGNLETWREPQLFHVGDKTFLAYAAAAYRTPDDQRPGIGWAWEPVPGPTSFTRDSELQNAETSAWGRAIAALGFEVRKGIATREDVRTRRGAEGSENGSEGASRMLNEGQREEIGRLLKDAEQLAPTRPGQMSWLAQWREEFRVMTRDELTYDEAVRSIEWLNQMIAAEKVPF